MKSKILFLILAGALVSLLVVAAASGQKNQVPPAASGRTQKGAEVLVHKDPVIPREAAAPKFKQPALPGLAGLPLAVILKEKGIPGPIPDLKILVDKSDHLLTLYSGAVPLKSYQIALGDGGLGDKQWSGDHKTPEGTFYIAERSVLSPADRYLGSRWLRVSYPNLEDARRGLAAGIIDQAAYQEIGQANNNREIPLQATALGGGIGIHGGSRTGDNQGDYWTWGCIGLTNFDVNEIYDYIPVGTELVIRS